MRMQKFSKYIGVVYALLAVCMAFVGCKPAPTPSGSFTPPVDEEPYVLELKISTPPVKTEYKAGQVFDTAGMKLVAKWSDDVDEDLSPGECKMTPTGPLAVGTTEITFTYEGALASQPITVQSVEVTDIVFDFSAIKSIQPLGMIDLTEISVKAIYDDGSEDPVTSKQYEMFENEIKIDDPSAYNVTRGSHTITVKYGQYSQSFSFAAVYTYDVPIRPLYLTDTMAQPIAEKKNFLEKPNESFNYIYLNDSSGTYIGEVIQGSIFRFHIYSEVETQAELVFNLASSRLLEGDWSAPKKMGEVQFNKGYDVNIIEVDPETGMPVMNGESENKTPIEIGDDVILPGSFSVRGNTKILENYVDVSFGETTLKEGYNIIEIRVKDCAEYTIAGKLRLGNIKGFSARALNSDEHEHTTVKINEKKPTCAHYGEEEYYRCTVCARIFSDEEAQTRIFNPALIQPDSTNHEWDREHADCTHDQVCIEDGTVGEVRTPHTFEHDNCTYDGMQECSVCHEIFQGGHVSIWDHNTLKCTQCNKELGYKIQAEDKTTVKYKKPDGSTLSPTLEGVTNTGLKDADNKAIFIYNGAENGNAVSGIEEAKGWNGVTMEIPVTVDEAGTYLFSIRTSANGGDGGKTAQDLASIFSYCVNPDGSNYNWQAVGGKAIASSPTGGWQKMYRWGITVLAEVELNVGANTVILKFNENGWRGPNIDYFMFEKKNDVNRREAEIITTRTDGNLFAVGEDAVPNDLILTGVYMRIAVPADKIEEFGAIYYDAEITKDMCYGTNFSTVAAGTYTAEFTVTMFDKQYKATFEYVVR